MIGNAHAVLLAAGEGRRFDAGESKGLVPIWGRPLLSWSLAMIASHQRIGEIVLVIPPGGDARERIARVILTPMGLADRVRLADGGSTRVDSAKHGVAALPAPVRENPSEIVLIHDAARPLITRELIDRCIAALESPDDFAGVVPALPVRETLKRVEGAVIRETLSREGLWAAQTPQAFRMGPLLEAQRAAASSTREFTDDASMLEAAGLRVCVVPGEVENVKVTYPEDRLVVERILRERGRNL